jgi:cytochrome c-type biogenesis protein CcmH/NrfG
MSQDSNEQTLAELRRIRFALYFLLAVLVLGLLPAFVKGVSQGLSQGTSEAAPSWERVRTAMNHQDFHAALPMAKALVERQPNYYYGQAYLGAIYLALGDVTNAEPCYARAYQLFPNEEGEKDLAAARKRLGEQQGVKLLSK